MICGVLLVCGCQKKNHDNELTTTGCEKGDNEIMVTCSSWSGWSEDYEPVEEIFLYPVEKGTMVKPTNKNIVGPFEFRITAVSPNSITIRTNQCMSCKKVEEAGINLNSKEDTFEIKKGEAIKLTTLTTDCGDIYIIQY